jgi:glyoxylase-like metal-dependent hydrolase (beta-lactamase superfamily II)/rhodanese-related sulfurtransferase
MKIEQIYTECLSQGTYYIESNGEVAIIDPLREIDSYLKRAKENNAKIKYIFETHIHADFVSGHLTLSNATGAPIIFGPNTITSYPVTIAKDRQVFKLGNLTFVALHTPGHTLESTTYLLKDDHGKDHAIFTGDTLFIGDVGRPDLAQKQSGMTQRDMAGMLFDSLRKKIMPLSDDVIVYPAHGAGSACGKKMSKETFSTLGIQKSNNYALDKSLKKEEFINDLTEGLESPPTYFPMNVKMNQEGYNHIENVLRKNLNPFDPDEFEKLANQSGVLILDVRNQIQFAEEHIPGSIFIGIDGGFAPWVGAIVGDVKRPILLITPRGREEETITRLARVGFDNALGFLEGGLSSWKVNGRKTDSVSTIQASKLGKKIFDQTKIIDVRKNSEFSNGHLKNALNIPLDQFSENFDKIPLEGNFFVHCAGGYRSMIASSILKSRGINSMTDILGGFSAIKSSGIPIEV